MKKNSKLNNNGFSHFEMILIVVVVAVISAVGFVVYQSNNKSKADSETFDESVTYTNDELLAELDKKDIPLEGSPVKLEDIPQESNSTNDRLAHASNIGRYIRPSFADEREFKRIGYRFWGNPRRCGVDGGNIKLLYYRGRFVSDWLGTNYNGFGYLLNPHWMAYTYVKDKRCTIWINEKAFLAGMKDWGAKKRITSDRAMCFILTHEMGHLLAGRGDIDFGLERGRRLSEGGMSMSYYWMYQEIWKNTSHGPGACQAMR